MSEPIHLVSRDAESPPAAPVALTFQAFFEAEKAGLFGALCLVTHNRHEAEELTQDAFVRLLERWDRVGAMEDPHAYLYRTAMNAFRSRYRRTLLAARRVTGATPPDDAIGAIDERDAAVRALATLPARQRAAVVLTDMLGYPSKDAARMLGIRASTLRMHASRARATLKATMQDD
jgi:RNA polymerase sigma-70 factor (ECF subfamily)